MQKILKRPVTIILFAILIAFFGVVSFMKMPVSLFPNVEMPIVSIATIYSGASPDIVETKVTKKIEEAVGGVNGIKSLVSYSKSGISEVVVEFELSKDLNEAVNDIRDKIGALLLPKEVDKPIVEKFDVASAPVMTLSAKAKGIDYLQFAKIVEDDIKPILENSYGVAKVNLIGNNQKTIKVLLKPFALAKYNITALEVQRVLQSSNFENFSGKVENQKDAFSIKTLGAKDDIEDIKNTRINSIRLADIADVVVEKKDATTSFNQNNRQAIGIDIIKVKYSNEIQIAKIIKEKLSSIEAMYPNIEISIIRNQTNYIEKTLNNLKFDIVLGAFLAIVITFMFLRSFSFTAMATVAIPISLLGVVGFLVLCGQTINLLSLIAMTLAVGFIIDDAIVVLEAIFVKIEEGYDKTTAIIEGFKGILFTIIGISSMLLCIFLPIAFMDGIVGRFFSAFGWTLVGAIIVSFCVVVFLIPIMANRYIQQEHSKLFVLTEPFFRGFENIYASIVSKVINYPIIVILLALSILISSFNIASQLGNDFMGKEDKSAFEMVVKANPNISLDGFHTEIKRLYDEVVILNDVNQSTLAIGTSNKSYEAKIYVQLKDMQDRTNDQFKIMHHFSKLSKEFKNLNISVNDIPDVAGGEINAPFQLVIRANSTQVANESANKLVEYLNTIDGVINANTDFEGYKKELIVYIDKMASDKLGINPIDIYGVVNAMLGANDAIAYYKEEAKEYNIVIRSYDRSDINILKSIQVRSNSGEAILLDSIATLKEQTLPANIKRYNRKNDVLVYAYTNGKIDLASVSNKVFENKDKWLLGGCDYVLEGDAKYMVETNGAFGKAFGLAILLVYAVLAVLYESFVLPILVMVALPFSFSGAFFALYMGGLSFSLFSMMALLLLLGLTGKNSALLVDFALHQLREGIEANKAIIGASKARLRPILMTTIAMIGGMIPLLLISGEGEAVYKPLATALIGGLLFSMVLSLIVVPAVLKIYSKFMKKK